MVRLAVMEDLGDMQGRLTAGFDVATLQGRFLFALGQDQRLGANQLLTAFSETAAVVGRHESAFAGTDRQGGLLRHLRSAEHFTALRDFRALCDEIMVLEPVAGAALVGHVRQDMVSRVVNGPVIPDKVAGIKSPGRPAVQKL